MKKQTKKSKAKHPISKYFNNRVLQQHTGRKLLFLSNLYFSNPFANAKQLQIDFFLIHILATVICRRQNHLQNSITKQSKISY